MSFKPVFSSNGTLSPSDYIKAVVASVLSLVTYYLAVRFIPGLVCSKSAMNEGTGSGACVFPVVGLLLLLPVLFLALAYSIGAASMRRARDAGLPAFVGVLIPLLILANQDIVFYESYGTPFRKIPWFLLFAVLCIGLLSLLPTRRKRINLESSILPTAILTIGVLIALASVLHAILAIPALAMGTGLMGPGGHNWVLGQFMRSAPYLMPVFAVMAGLFVFQQRSLADAADIAPHGDIGPSSRQTEDSIDDDRYPWVPFVIGVALTGVLLSLGSETRIFLNPPAIVFGLFTTLLPTYALYTFPVWAAWRYQAARKPIYLALLVIALVPFALWHHARTASIETQAREREEVAKIETVPLTGSPATILFENIQGVRYDCLLRATGTTEVIAKVGFGRNVDLKSYKGRTRYGQYALDDVSGLPEEYLDLRVGQASSFAGRHRAYRNDGGPFELRYITPERDDLIAVDYMSVIPEPVVPPVLSIAGWFSSQPKTTTDDVSRKICDFAKQAVARR